MACNGELNLSGWKKRNLFAEHGILSEFKSTIMHSSVHIEWSQKRQVDIGDFIILVAFGVAGDYWM
jgi:hypothetical protein